MIQNPSVVSDENSISNTISNSTSFELPKTAKAGEFVQSSNALSITVNITSKSGLSVPYVIQRYDGAPEFEPGFIFFVMPSESILVTIS